MDDGAKDLETSLQMLRLLRRQGVAKAALTSHYYPHKESLDSFLKRREVAWQRLRPHTGTEEYPELLLGAEIYVTRGLSRAEPAASLHRENRSAAAGASPTALQGLDPRRTAQPHLRLGHHPGIGPFGAVPFVVRLQRLCRAVIL